MHENTTCGYYLSEDDEKKEAFATLCAKVEQDIVPCAKTVEEIKTYLTENMGMHQIPMSEGEKKICKAQFIEKHRSDLLSTPLPEFPADRIPTSQEMTAMMNNQAKRFKEAMGIPMEKTGFVFTKYVTEQFAENESISKVEVILEESGCNITASSQGTEHTEEDVRRFLDDIVLFRGVTEEDIRTKSVNYVSYVGTKAVRLREEL